MKLIYQGKTKDVYALQDGNYLLKFKDSVTVDEKGAFDPGQNKVGHSIEGMGLNCLRLTDYFYRKIQTQGIPTHLLSVDFENASMTVRPAVMFGNGLEVICRFKATGSFMRRYGSYAKEGQELGALVEITLKDDERGDPLINQDALEALGILQRGEYETLRKLTQKIAALIKDELAAKGMELYDMKLEFGRAGKDGEIILADEISGGSLRAYKDGKQVEPLELTRLVLEPT